MTEYSQIRYVHGPKSFGCLNVVPGLTRILGHDLLIMNNISKANLMNKNLLNLNYLCA